MRLYLIFHVMNYLYQTIVFFMAKIAGLKYFYIVHVFFLMC